MGDCRPPGPGREGHAAPSAFRPPVALAGSLRTERRSREKHDNSKDIIYITDTNRITYYSLANPTKLTYFSPDLVLTMGSTSELGQGQTALETQLVQQASATGIRQGLEHFVFISNHAPITCNQMVACQGRRHGKCVR